jgi:hypothetical protein
LIVTGSRIGFEIPTSSTLRCATGGGKPLRAAIPHHARRRLSQGVGKTLRKKLTWRTFVFASIDGYHVISLGICIGLAMAMLTLLVTGVLH